MDWAFRVQSTQLPSKSSEVKLGFVATDGLLRSGGSDIE